MRSSLLGVLVLVFTAAPASAQSIFDHPSTHTEYDWQSGNRYETEHHNNAFEQDTHVRGSNIYTGSTWETTIDSDGDMNGRDADGNMWRYDEGSKLYQNYGTGETCIGSGAARSCF